MWRIYRSGLYLKKHGSPGNAPCSAGSKFEASYTSKSFHITFCIREHDHGYVSLAVVHYGKQILPQVLQVQVE